MRAGAHAHTCKIISPSLSLSLSAGNALGMPRSLPFICLQSKAITHRGRRSAVEAKHTLANTVCGADVRILRPPRHGKPTEMPGREIAAISTAGTCTRTCCKHAHDAHVTENEDAHDANAKRAASGAAEGQASFPALCCRFSSASRLLLLLGRREFLRRLLGGVVGRTRP